MKKKAKKILALILSLALIMSTVVMNFSVAAVSLEEGESFDRVTYSKSFSWLGLTEIDGDFSSAIIASDGTVTIGTPSTQWSTATQPTGIESWEFQNHFLKPKGNGNTYLMTLNNAKTVNFKASIEFLNAWREYGIIFGQATPTDIDTTNGAVKIRMQENAGKIMAYGTRGNTATFVNADKDAGFYVNDSYIYDKATRPDFDSNVNSTNLHTLNIEVLNGVMKVWWTGYEDYAWTVSLSDKYSGGYISLYSTGCQQGGIKNFDFEDLGGFTEYNKDFTNINVSAINKDFNSAIIASDGTVTEGKASAQWSTAKQPTGSESWEFQNSYLKPTGNGKTYLLTLNNTKTINFRASLTFLNAWREYGIYFGQSTPTDITVSDTATNGVVKVRMQENAGKILAQGVQASTSKWVDVSRTEGFYYNADKQYLAYDQVTKFSTDVNGTNLHTLNIEVINGLMKLWWTGFEEYAWTVELNNDYKGGYISLYSTGCQQGGIKSFTFEDLGGYIQSFNWLGLGEINNEFYASKIAKDGTITEGATVGEIWSTDVNPSGSTSYGMQNHFLKPKANDGATNLLTLKDVKVKNFRATMQFLNNWHDYGIYFGQTTPTDISASNGVVKVGMQGNAGRIQVVGIDTFTSKWEGSADYGAFYPYKDATKNNACNNVDISGFDSNVNSTNLHTLNIEVIDGQIKVWWSEYPDVVWSASLNENYKGGYISLYSTGNAHGGIRDFAVMELPESDYTFVATETTELDDKFTSTVYDTENGTVTTTKVSENWRLDNTSDSTIGKGAIEDIYYNNALKPFGRASAKKVSVLTLNDELSNNFELKYTYIPGHTGNTLYFSDSIYNPNVSKENALSITINNAKIGESYYPLLYVGGAIDVESAALADSNVTLYSYGGNTVNSYLSDLGMVYDDVVKGKTRTEINVKVQDGTLTAWVTGYEGAAITVKLTAKYNANKLSFYTNGCDQGGMVNLNIDELADDAKKTANVTLNIEPMDEYTAVTLNTSLAYSNIIADLVFDNSAFEYYASAINMNQLTINDGKVLEANDGVIPVDLYANNAGEIVTLYFKNLTNSMNYSGFALNSMAVNVVNKNSANANGTKSAKFDYTEDCIVDVRDVVRTKHISASDTPTVSADTITVIRKLIMGDYSFEGVSPLLGKTALYLGDSIAYGALDELGLAWAGRIAQNGMTYENVAVSGWAVTNTETSGRGQIVTQLDKATKSDYDFVILEGGVNDVLMTQHGAKNIAWGEITAEGTEFDTSTICGAIEDLIVKTQAKFPDAVVGYVINNYYGATEENMTKYIETVKAACDKHGIAYVDLYNDEYVKANFVNSKHLPDNLHPNAAGYDIISKAITEWMESLVLTDD